MGVSTALAEYSWTQPVCDPCFEEMQPGRSPIRVRDRTDEVCCKCGHENADGIFVRVDPRLVPFPTKRR